MLPKSTQKVTILLILAKWCLIFEDFKKEPPQNMQQSIKAKSRPARKRTTSGAFGKTS
jgi:hypothetical protein